MATKKCAHEGCSCMVTDKEKYCSQRCEDAEKTGTHDLACPCPHPECTGKL